MGVALALLALVLWSTTNIVTKFAVGVMDLYVGVLVAAAANVVFAALLFGAQVLWFRPSHPLDPGAAAMFLLSGVFSTYLGRWFFFATIARLGPGAGERLPGHQPHVHDPDRLPLPGGAPEARPLGGGGHHPQRPRPGELCAGCLGVPGQWGGRPGVNAPRVLWGAARQGAGYLLHSGALLAFGSSVSYAVANVLRGAAVRRWSEPVLGGAIAALAGLVAQGALMGDVRTSLRRVFRSERRGLMLYTLTGALMIGAQISLIGSMAYIPIGVANLIGLATPLLVTPASMLLLKNQEGITGKTLLGMCLVLTGIAVLVLR